MYIVFDVEVKQISEETHDYDLKSLGVSYMAYYRSDTDKIDGFFDEDVPKFKALMDEAELVIGYNIIGFDFPVLEGYFPVNLPAHRVCDLYKVIHEQHKIHLKLDNLTTATFGAGKIAHGLDAIRFYREGKLDKLKEYCDMDVKLTADLYKFIKENGYCYYTDGLGNKVKLEVNLNIKAPELQESTSPSEDFSLF